ncbi:MAG: ribonuclease HII [Flavobacteriales bacterium]|nr:ribonuclease HII [Flavobacteriales bacterium]|tara:strand:+ start:6415 stop:7011 length:597 start_codon:yes stop_codon:yes gene_type:complete
MLSKYDSKKLVAGCDESGRGCLAGPVVSAAVILPKNFNNKSLNDSKKLTKEIRNKLKIIIEKQAISWAIGIVSCEEIDKINILNASILAMHRAIKKLNIKPELLIIDGNRFKPFKDIKHKCIVKGDSKYCSIAAASILAKTYRDDIMINLDTEEPKYKWKKNKGYPTKEHKNAIQEIGISKHHRRSFKLLTSQLSLEI